ncbi:LytTR family DNA-binding domain-containing protein [Pontibacter sp. G13]|uniref:LytR/AlgR family response regulator transcription factor n=1 Tax=Pontibacter sp. G13 TaxID=3074898 RepID=UPI002889B990|nr:LytTR family DNA-binding domain-containing protein [Pontibacter sp. G13]WNJ15942.1 LytTR family DNA-binding domain-containing protein [Pontibacter sp. G13]
MKAIMVEDEIASRETLRNYLTKYCPSVELVAEAPSVAEGLKAIALHQPDLVFLDVEMPYGNAFDLLEQVQDITFETIFVTAYSHYAVQALNFSASYYLLKPIDIEELIQAVSKVEEAQSQKQDQLRTKILIDNLKTMNHQLKKVVLPVMDGFEVVQVKDIIRCQANGNFTDFYLADGSKRMICRTLKFYDEILSQLGFCRVHKSHLINLEYILSYKKGKGGTVLLQGNHEVEVSPSRKKEFLNHFIS